MCTGVVFRFQTFLMWCSVWYKTDIDVFLSSCDLASNVDTKKLVACRDWILGFACIERMCLLYIVFLTCFCSWCRGKNAVPKNTSLGFLAQGGVLQAVNCQRCWNMRVYSFSGLRSEYLDRAVSEMPTSGSGWLKVHLILVTVTAFWKRIRFGALLTECLNVSIFKSFVHDICMEMGRVHRSVVCLPGSGHWWMDEMNVWL